MSHTPHELVEEFPDQVERIQALKVENGHFLRLAEEYHEVNRTIHRAETNVDPVDDSYEAALRRRRLLLKDQIARMLRQPA
ncbi:MAG: DUF465 domain-containing protein [Pseudomonadota bacterium]